MRLRNLAVLLAALWWGGLSALSFVAVPTLFASLGSPAVAGPVAARLFSLQAWGGLLLGLALLLIFRLQREKALGAIAPAEVGELQAPALASLQSTLGTMGFVLFAMLMALLQEFGVAQKIVSARASGGPLHLWHSLGSVMVLGQWLCAGTVLWRIAKEK